MQNTFLKGKGNNVILALSFFITIVIYHIIYGIGTLNPQNINWLMSVYHDWGGHYEGWAFFKNEPWGYPLGDVSGLYYPVGTNVGLTDSIPLLALFFKLFAFILPDDFQYFGLWLFACHFFAAFYTLKILKLYNVSMAIQVLAALFVTLSPVLIFRGIHPALCAHFLILASLYNFLRPESVYVAKKINISQFIIFFIAATVNPYIAAMVAGFNIIIPAKHFIKKHIKLPQLIIYPAASFASTYLFYLVTGMVSLKNSDGSNLSSVETIRDYSFNLNAFYNSYGVYSKFLPHFGYVTDKQYEGYAYFGVGIIIMLIAAVICVVSGKFSIKRLKPYALLIALCVALFLFAVTNAVTFNNTILFTCPIPGFIDRTASIFRASGRFVWPLYYMVIIGAVIILTRIKVKQRIIEMLLALLLIIQLYDIQYLILKNNFPSGSYNPPQQEEKWVNIFKQFDKVITYPTHTAQLIYRLDYQDLCFLALKAGKPITNGYVSRDKDRMATGQYKADITDRLNAGEIDNEIYVTTPDYLEDFSFLINLGKVKVHRLDNFLFIYNVEKDIEKYFTGDKDEKNFITALTSKYFGRNTISKFNSPYSTKQIKYNFDIYNETTAHVQMKGWAFLESTQDNRGDSIQVALIKNNNILIADTEISPRSDVTRSNNGRMLDDSGFSSSIVKNRLQKGSYQVALLIKSKGKYYYQATDKKINIDKDGIITQPKSAAINSTVSEIKYDFSQFIPAGKKGELVFVANASVKSPILPLNTGKYKITLKGRSYPDKPIKNEHAHFILKFNGKTIGNFYLDANPARNHEFIFENTNDTGQIEIIYDNDVIVGADDRNAILNAITITPAK